VRAGGGTAPLALDLSAAHVLGPLAGPEWADLGPAVERAAALGRADRVAACRAAHGARACTCS
jgi:hypothetical protein